MNTYDPELWEEMKRSNPVTGKLQMESEESLAQLESLIREARRLQAKWAVRVPIMHVVADYEEMQHSFVHQFEMAHDRMRPLITHEKADVRLLVRSKHRRRDLEIQEVGPVVGGLGADQRHAALRTRVAGPAANVRVHGAPVDRLHR